MYYVLRCPLLVTEEDELLLSEIQNHEEVGETGRLCAPVSPRCGVPVVSILQKCSRSYDRSKSYPERDEIY